METEKTLNFKNKLTIIDKSCPHLDDFLIKGFDKEYAETFVRMFKLNLKHEKIIPYDSLFEMFRHNINFSDFAVLGFDFIDFIEFDDFYQLGTIDVDLLVLLKSTNEIAIIDFYNFEISSLVSDSFDSFINLLPILISYDKIGFLGGSYTDEIKNQIKISIKNIISDSKYYSYFINIIPS